MALDDNCRRRFLSNDDGNSEQESAIDVMTRSSLDRELIKTAAKVAPTRPNKRTNRGKEDTSLCIHERISLPRHFVI
ncbi:unnamed protein product [Brugia pahangi]|uniref:Uncharacterized protein n=1 Tax=Brugia pahangi TaxID=6280 RepID=A0A0N4TJK1_BRUPA|nr:unnamed protein product [Brugia pahangi]